MIRYRPEGGLTIFFTGLPGSGKTTLAEAIRDRLVKEESRSVSILDGDVVRGHLSAGLGFTKEDRDTHIGRIGFVAEEITKAGGIVICPVIAPYAEARDLCRLWVTQYGDFVLVHVSTPLGVCEMRDPKGIYGLARAGAIEHFTGISDPYEVPENADMVIDAAKGWPEQHAEAVHSYLKRNSLLRPRGG